MFRLPNVPSADALIDHAYHAGSKEGKKARAMGPMKPEKILTGEIRRVEIIAAIIQGDLNAIVEHFPRYEDMPDFQKSLLELMINKDRYKKSLATVRWCSERIDFLKNKTLRKLKTIKDPALSSEFMGRAGSFVKRIKPELAYLQEAKMIIISFPILREAPTLVVAGIPNAGKSTFVRALTGSKVKVASYPFTTTEILVGYKTHKYKEYQIIDSPGILDRPMSERNHVELQAVLALRHLADIVLFLIDPQAELQPQLNLMEEIKQNFDLKVIAAVNDKGTGTLPGYESFNATNPEECEKMFLNCFEL